MGFQESIKALSHPTRRKILKLLKRGRMSAGEIGEHFQMTGATISHHLSILKHANLISCEKEGTFIYYEINLSVMEELFAWFQDFLKEGEAYETKNKNGQ
ncbi:MAG: winged helix-turn-helix transcriptional regulator [Clostridiales bacterium]|nr:winged helix-turn-helix transcriptional regulator [Clostridiales bacterium]